MNAVESILKNRDGNLQAGFIEAVKGIQSTLLHLRGESPNSAFQSFPAQIPLKLTVVHYEDRPAAINSLEGSARARVGAQQTVRCVVLDEVHHALDIQDDELAVQMENALEAQRGESGPALLLCLTGTLPSVEAFCTVSSLVRSGSHADQADIRLLDRTACTRNFADSSVTVKVVAKIFKVVVPVIKLTLPAVEWLRGNSVVTALLGSSPQLTSSPLTWSVGRP